MDDETFRTLVESYKAAHADYTDHQIENYFSSRIKEAVASMHVNTTKPAVNPHPVRSFVSRKGTLYPKG